MKDLREYQREAIASIPEEWKDIQSYEGLYQISNLGRVKSIQRNITDKLNRKYTIKEKILTPWLSNKYPWVCLSTKSKRYKQSIHRLMGFAFLTKGNNKAEINHKDGKRNNNNINNLEWCTRQENCIHAYNLGLTKHPTKGKFGKDCPFTKKIKQYTLNNEFIGIIYGAHEAERLFKIPNANIIACCKGKRKSAGNYIWRYSNE